MLTTTDQIDAISDSRLCEAVAIHCDPKWGSPYWIERASQLRFDPRTDIRSTADLFRLGLTDASALADRALGDFLPRSLQSSRSKLIVAQTGGTLGRPAWTAYLEDEFNEAFVEPFSIAADHVGFPREGNWLYVGPSGPHVIGLAADAIARRSGSQRPFMVDFDPRWAKKLPADSFAARRYLQHVIEQALAILQSQQINILFTTPPILTALSSEMTTERRERIRGVHYGGMALEPEALRRSQTEDFPNAVHLSGYGNTLFGCCLELNVAPSRPLRYYPFGNRLHFGVVETATATNAHAAPIIDSPGASGQLVFSRFDRTVLLVNILERDHVQLVPPPRNAPPGFRRMGVESPHVPATATHRAAIGLY